jgi:hypothetical protein
MRKLLLASVATLGFAGAANAAMMIEMNPATTPPSVGDTTGVVKPAPISAWNAPKANPDPGKIITHVDGLVAVDIGAYNSSGLRGQSGTPNAATKADHYNMGSYFRLYFGFDGKLTNGMLYGAMSEMRTVFDGPNNGAANYTTTGSISASGSGNATDALWYTRRAYVYMGAPNVGLFRLGEGDGVASLWTQPSITTGEQYDTGQWDGDAGDFLPGNVSLAWAFNDIGAEYDPQKVVYITPSFFGFVFAVDFAPNSSALTAGGTSNNAATGALAQQSSSTLPSDWARPRNMFEVGSRYTGSFGPVSLEGSIAFQKSAVVGNASLPPSANAGVTKFKGVDDIDAGLGVTAFGASVYGHFLGGTMNGTMTPQAEIPGRSKDGVSWIEGVMYSFGPWTVGTSFYSFESEGTNAAFSAPIPAGFAGAGTTVKLGNRAEHGLDFGGTYNLAPGCNLYAEYIIGWRHQVGVNFIDPAGSPANGNQTYVGAALLTAAFVW